MSLGGGLDRSWMRPLTAQGRVDTDDPDFENMVGVHQGPGLGYNVINPQPGCQYTWERLPQPGQANDLIRVRMEGGQIVHDGDPEMAAFTPLQDRGESPTTKPTSLDGSHNNGEVVLVRWPESAVRQRYERERKAADNLRRGGAEDDWVNGASPAERASSNQPTRFRRADHSLQREDHRGNIVDVWQPDQGIIPQG